MGEQTLQIPHYIDVDPEKIDAELNEEQLAFEHFRQSFTTEEMGSIRVQKVPISKSGPSNPGRIRGIHCFSCPVDQFTFDGLLDHIRDTYGGGMYRVMGTQSGKKGQAFNRLVEIASPYEHAKTPDSSNNKNTELSSILNTVNAMVAESTNRMEEMLSRFSPQIQQANPMGYLKDTIEMLSTMGVIGNQNKGGDGLAELRKFVELKTLAGELLGNEGGSAGEANFYTLMSETVKQFGGPLLMAMNAGVKSGAINPQPRAQVAAPIAAAPSQPSEPSAEQMQQIQELKNQVAILLMQAKAGISAVDFAAVVINQTPDDKLEELHEFIGADNCIEKLTQLNPEVEKFQGWFQKLREEILRELDAMLEPEESDALHSDNDGGIVAESEGAVTGNDNLKAVPDATIERTPSTDTKPATGGNANDSNGDPERGAGDTPNP